jgi:RNA 2',3'-cyclic 3'-phosphodiesterase
MDSLRCFLAADPPSEVQEKLARLVAGLASHDADVKWVAPDCFHLTLKFFERVSPAQNEQIGSLLERTCRQEAGFRVRLSSPGGFPNLRRPNILWLGCDRGQTELCALAGRIQTELEAGGFQRDARPFHPHLTLGRVRNRRGLKSLIECLTRMDEPVSDEYDLKELIWYRSTLTPVGPSYEALRRFRLT